VYTENLMKQRVDIDKNFYRVVW